MNSLNLKKVLSLICMISILLLSFGCGESEQEKREKAKLGASIAPEIINLLSIPMVNAFAAPLYAIDPAKKENVEEAKRTLERFNEARELIKKNVPKKITLLKGWDDFYSEALSLFSETEDLMEDYYDLLLKSYKGKNILSDIKDYKDDVDKYSKKVEKVKELYSPAWEAYAH